MSTSKTKDQSSKKVDWFVVLLYAIVIVGIGLVAWALIALMTPAVTGGR